MQMSSVVKIDPEIMSGAPCFSGTRVTIQTLIDHLEAGDSIEDFLDGFPSVSREQVIAFLKNEIFPNPQTKKKISTALMSSVVKIDPEIMSGAPCFSGTRVPIQNLIDYLEGGDTIEEFLDGFPTVSREQVIAFLEEAKDRMVASVAE